MKKENATLTKRLKQYALMTAPMLAVASMANGQVLYTDIDPDFSLTDSTAADGGWKTDLDLDNDGVMDYTFVVFNSTSGYSGNLNLVGAKPYSANGNGIMGYGSAPFYYPSALNAGVAVDSNGSFWSQASYYGTLVWYYIPGAGASGTFGQWSNATDKYMGVRFLGGDGLLHNGWLRMDVVNNPPTVVIKDFAYESQDNVAINTGDVGVAVPSVDQNNQINIVSFEKSVFISTPVVSNDPMIVTVTDLMGKTLVQQQSTQSNVRLSLRDLANSIYLVTVQKGTMTKTAKVSLR